MAASANSSRPQQRGNDEDSTVIEMVKVLKDLQQEYQKLKNTSSNQPGDSSAAENATLITSKSDGGEMGNPSGAGNQQTGLRKTQSAILHQNQNREVKLEELIHKLQSHVRQLKRDKSKLRDLQADVDKALEKNLNDLCKVLQDFKCNRSRNARDDMEVISRNIFNLICRLPLLPDKRRKDASDSQNDDDYRGGRVDVYLPGIHKNVKELTESEAYREVINNFKSLKDIEQKMCLLSFAVFPENGVLNRRMLMYWWIGEGFLKVEGAEEKVDDFLKEFEKKGLIEPVEDRRKKQSASYKMPPLVHSAVVRISKALEFFDIYDENGKPKMQKSETKKVCLVEGSSSKDEAKATKMQPGDIETVFNVSERFPDFTFKWFKEMKSLKVLYLGRWERTAERHIEVESPELMKDLSALSQLRLLSLQGISRIERLDSSVCKLHKLTILDLRACYNLEKLPEKIDSLKNLVYLDISECYMIERMPKRLAWLEKLEVLKGFVVSDADEETTCALIELKHLKKLRKLSVTINRKDFGVVKLKEALVQLEALESLKVAWGGISKGADTGKKPGASAIKKKNLKAIFTRQNAAKHEHAPTSLGERLKKLDLQCFPDAQLPQWLQPPDLCFLKKLYIKGGTELTGLGPLPDTPTDCAVEVLRLKFLPKLQVEWRDLKELYFPNLKFLEKYQCPRVTLCPCDGMGMWESATSS